MQNERSDKALVAALEALTPFYDTVQIMVSKNKEDDITIGQAIGRGSMFARIGQVELWLDKVRNAMLADEESDDYGEEPTGD